jgi:hypothetical protein
MFVATMYAGFNVILQLFINSMLLLKLTGKMLEHCYTLVVNMGTIQSNVTHLSPKSNIGGLSKFIM